MENLQIPAEAVLPLIFSIKYGGSWSIKTSEIQVTAIKEKFNYYDEDQELGYTLEKMHLFINPQILEERGKIHRLEKCSQQKERRIVTRPYQLKVDAEKIFSATLNPLKKKIQIKRVKGPLIMKGSPSFGLAHEMGHLKGEDFNGEIIADFEYDILK